MAHCSASRLRSLCHLWEAAKTHRAWQHAITWELCRERNRMMLKYETILLRATSDNHQTALIAPAVNSGFSCKETFFHYDRSFRISCSHLVRSMWRAQKGSILYAFIFFNSYSISVARALSFGEEYVHIYGGRNAGWRARTGSSLKATRLSCLHNIIIQWNYSIETFQISIFVYFIWLSRSYEAFCFCFGLIITI